MGLFSKDPETFADRVGKKPQLLTGEFSFCSHSKGYWYESESKVSDGTGTYLQIRGGCKTCKRQVAGIYELKSELV